MKFSYYGQSCFLVELSDKNILFDPFITPNELAKDINIDDIKADYILLSHGHGDHIADCVQIAKKNNSTVVGGFEVVNWVKKQGVESVHPLNHGGKWNFDFGSVKSVNAIHSSDLPDGSYGGNPMGFVIKGEKTFYYAGDTALTMDMQLVPRWGQLDFAVLPIGDNFTMGYEDAIIAAELIQCSNIVGCHYDTFGYIKIDHDKVKKAFIDAGLTLHLPGIGETIDL